MRLLLHLKRQFFALVQLILGIFNYKKYSKKLENTGKGYNKESLLWLVERNWQISGR